MEVREHQAEAVYKARDVASYFLLNVMCKKDDNSDVLIQSQCESLIRLMTFLFLVHDCYILVLNNYINNISKNVHRIQVFPSSVSGK